jgi:hypothetical protein
MDPFLWNSLPAIFKPTPSAAADGQALPPGLRGGLEIEFFGHRLRRGAQPALPPAMAYGAAPPVTPGVGPGGMKIKLPQSMQRQPSAGGGAGGGAPFGDGGAVPPGTPMALPASGSDPDIGEPPVRQFIRKASEMGVRPCW